MKLGPITKTAPIVSTLLLLCCGVWVGFGSRFVTQALNQTSQHSAEYFSESIGRQLDLIFEELINRGQLLIDAGQKNFSSQEDQLLFLKKYIATDDRMLAVSIYRKRLAVNQSSEAEIKAEESWRPYLLLIRNREDPSKIGSKEIETLDAQFPIDFKRVESGKPDIVSGSLPDGKPILRLAKQLESNDVLVVEVATLPLLKALQNMMGQKTPVFVIHPNGHLLFQNAQKTPFFKTGDLLDHLPIVQGAREADVEKGGLIYRLLPNTPLLQGGFFRLHSVGAWVISHTPPADTTVPRNHFLRISGGITLGILFLGIFLYVVLTAAVSRDRQAPRKLKKRISFRKKHTPPPHTDTHEPSLGRKKNVA